MGLGCPKTSEAGASEDGPRGGGPRGCAARATRQPFYLLPAVTAASAGLLPLPGCSGVPVIGMSALTGRGTGELLPAALRMYQKWNQRVPTAKLNRWVEQASLWVGPTGRWAGADTAGFLAPPPRTAAASRAPLAPPAPSLLADGGRLPDGRRQGAQPDIVHLSGPGCLVCLACCFRCCMPMAIPLPCHV